MSESAAVDTAVALLVAAVRGGVRDVVVCPGSRSQALALVAAELEGIGAISLHVRVDERSAGFFALGLAAESGRAVPVITTSGSAVAELAPAMLEAFHSGVPLVALTADRPEWLRTTGANQTTTQPGIFGPLVAVRALPTPSDGRRASDAELADAEAAGAALAATPAPLHLNIPFIPPLSGTLPDLAALLGAAPDAQVDAAQVVNSAPKTPQVVKIYTTSGEKGADFTTSEDQGADAGTQSGAQGEVAAPPSDPEVGAREREEVGARERESDAVPATSRRRGLSAELAAAIAADLAAHAPVVREATEETADAGNAQAVADRREPGDTQSVTGDPYRVAGDGHAAAGDQEGDPRNDHAAAGDQDGDARNTLAITAADYPNAVVIAGDKAGHEAEHLARDGGWPLIAEVSSGARFGPNLIVAAREFLKSAPPFDLVIVAGKPTLSREADALITTDGPRLVILDREGAPPLQPRANAEHTARLRIQGPPNPATATRLERAIAASQAHLAQLDSDPAAPDVNASRVIDARGRAAFGRQELEVLREPLTREILVDAVWRVTWPHDRLVVAASRLIRELDKRVPGKRIRVHANRGLAGIDGTIATALGVATASQRAGAAGTTRLLIGDLAFLHDVGSLLVGQAGEEAPRMQIIIGDDGGGTIFDGLEVAKTAGRETFDRVQYTPMNVDFEALAAAYGWSFRRAATRGDLEAALTDAKAPRAIIQVPLER